MHGKIVCCVLTAILLAGCKKSEPEPAPKAIVRIFVQAMTTGDGAGIRQSSVGDENSASYLTALANFNVATDRVVAASRVKFGPAAEVLAVKRAGDHYATVLTGLDSQPEVITGEQATVGSGYSKIYLRKTPDGWRVDRALQVPPGDMTSVIADWVARSAIYKDVSAGIESGDFPTPEAAKAAIWGKTMKLILEREPATRPTSSTTTRPSGS